MMSVSSDHSPPPNGPLEPMNASIKPVGRILLVEPNHNVRAALESVFVYEGFDVHAAEYRGSRERAEHGTF
jgi:hypothetical protein